MHKTAPGRRGFIQNQGNHHPQTDEVQAGLRPSWNANGDTSSSGP